MSSPDEDLPDPKKPMALETASYIHQLNPANPSGADRIHQGDDHIRLMKAVLKATFPNFTGPLTLSQDELAALQGLSTPVGFIGAWYGAAAEVPAGWAICNGQTVARSDGTGDIQTPDLRDRTIVGAGGAYTVGQTFGAVSAAANTGSAGAHSHTISGGGEHTHTGAVQGHALTVDQIPPHSHGYNRVKDGGSGVPGGNGGTLLAQTTSQTGGGLAHSHGLTIDSSTHTHSISGGEGAHTHSVSVSTLQPSGALYFIMKI